MLPSFLNELGYATRIHLAGQFATKDLPQPWQTLRKIFSRYLSTRVTGLHYAYLHLTSLIPYPRLTKIIVDHIMTDDSDVSKRLHEHHHKVENDDVLKSIFNYGKNKEQLGMRISEWMLMEEMKQTKHYKFMLFDENLVDDEIEKIVEGNDDVDENQFVDEILNSQEDPNTRIEHESHKERPEVEKSVELMIINKEEEEESVEDTLRRKKWKELKKLTASKPSSSLPKPKIERSKFFKGILARMSRRYDYMFRHMRQSFMPKKDMEAISDAVHHTLKKVVPPLVDKTTNDIVKKNLPKVVAEAIRLERKKVKDDIAAIVVNVVKKERESIRAELSVHVTNDVANTVPSQMKDDKQAHEVDLPIWMSLKIKFEKLVPLVEPCRVTAVRTRDHEDYHDDATRPKGESSAKRQKISKHGTFTRGESSSSQAMDESTPSSSGTLEQLEDFDAWQDDQGIDDDEVPSEECHQNCEEHQYHLDQMKSYMESQIVWESRKEDLTLQIPKKPSPVFQSCERNPKILPMSLVNQDLFYLMNGNSEERKYVPSLHKIHAFLFLENDLEELNTRWVKKTIKRFNMYARYVVDHWKSPCAQQAHIRRQLKQRDDPEEVYSEKKIIDERVHDYQLGLESHQQKVNLTAPTLTFPGIEEKKLLTITSDHVVGLIYENNKKEKRYIQERLKHHDQMRRWESYANGRPLELRRERLE
ncbi:hypothetical protein Tco_1294151 [Tanacetum coccineum]